MSKFSYWYAVLICIWLASAYLIFKHAPRTNERRINCSVAEFHPDYTPEMREQCRLVRSSRLL